MTKKSYYAVAKGHQIGIFTTWDECNKQVKGYSGASYKKFNNRLEAEEFISQNSPSDSSIKENSNDLTTIQPIDYDSLIKKDLEDNRVVAFVDGSFSNKDGEKLAGFGCYILVNEQDPIEISDKVHTKRFINHNNVTPEIFGALEAIKWALANEYEAITIYHDLEHTGKWATKEYKAKSEIAKFFVKELDEKYSSIINIKFVWVKGHDGIIYNERADQLASEAVNNQRKPIGKNGPNFFTGQNVSEQKVNEIIEDLKKLNDVSYSQNTLPNGGIRHTFEKVADNVKKEKLTVTFHPAMRTTVLQGKVESLFAEFLSRYTAHIPDFEMIRAYSDSYKTSIKKEDIDQKITILNLPSDYPNSVITLLKQSHVMLTLTRDEYDYTHYTLPAYRALEGHLKYLFEKSNCHLKEKDTIGSHFNKDTQTGLFFITNLTLKVSSFAPKIESAYNLYNNQRHNLLHFGEIINLPALDTTLLITQVEEARSRITEVLNEIQF